MKETNALITAVLTAKGIEKKDLYRAMNISRGRLYSLMNRGSQSDLQRIAEAVKQIEIEKAKSTGAAVNYTGDFMDMLETIKNAK